MDKIPLAVLPSLRRPLRPECAPDPLRDLLAAHIAATMVCFLDPDRISALAQDLRVVQRERVHDAGLVVCSLVLSAFARSTDTQGRFLDAQLTYRGLGGPDSTPRSFRNMARKLLPVLQEMLKRCLRKLADMASHPVLRGRLERFADVIIPDGCAFKLANALSGVYKGTGQPAELKLHAVYSLRARSVTRVDASAGSVHDSDGFWPERWESGALYIWDLGYNCYERFIDAAEAGAIPLQRLKAGANPVVVASYGKTGNRREVRDEHGNHLRLNEACQFGYVHRQQVLDLDVIVEDDRHRTRQARLVCVPCNGEDRYYLTELPRSIFTPYDVAELYRLRWEIELFFRDWKGAHRLDEVRRLSNPTSLMLAVTASLLAAALSNEIATGLEDIAAEYARQHAPAAFAAFPPCAAREAADREHRRSLIIAAATRRAQQRAGCERLG